ncbi:MAG: hypothetical protein NTU57_03120 [Candidatus Aenigmarchaeota archaeon]|nr:hypothetical protein [Candidatus Aenigmarchaeota archaeon]
MVDADDFPGAESSCQWFLGKKSFCGKLKKPVSCSGNMGQCPFCK